MKKLMSIALGLGLVLGLATSTFAQDKSTSKKEKTTGKRSKSTNSKSTSKM